MTEDAVCAKLRETFYEDAKLMMEMARLPVSQELATSPPFDLPSTAYAFTSDVGRVEVAVSQGGAVVLFDQEDNVRPGPKTRDWVLRLSFEHPEQRNRRYVSAVLMDLAILLREIRAAPITPAQEIPENGPTPAV